MQTAEERAVGLLGNRFLPPSLLLFSSLFSSFISCLIFIFIHTSFTLFSSRVCRSQRPRLECAWRPSRWMLPVLSRRKLLWLLVFHHWTFTDTAGSSENLGKMGH